MTHSNASDRVLRDTRLRATVRFVKELIAVRRLWTGMLLTAGLTLLLAGCATRIEGAKEPPHGWSVTSAGTQCDLLSGTYADTGEPADANANSWLYGAVWPVAGSLSSIVELGANAAPRDRDAAVRLTASVDGTLAFEGINPEGVARPLVPKQWACENGALVSRVSLNRPVKDETSKQGQALVRLWKSADGALIAEQTIESVKPGSASDSNGHKPLARFYFHFSPRT